MDKEFVSLQRSYVNTSAVVLVALFLSLFTFTLPVGGWIYILFPATFLVLVLLGLWSSSYFLGYSFAEQMEDSGALFVLVACVFIMFVFVSWEKKPLATTLVATVVCFLLYFLFF